MAPAGASVFILHCCCRRFFLSACDVPSLEDKFNVDQYSDLVTVSKPVIYISIGEIVNTHTVSSPAVGGGREGGGSMWSCSTVSASVFLC